MADKHDTSHVEDPNEMADYTSATEKHAAGGKHDVATSDSEEVVGFEIDESHLPKGYYHSRFFIGTFMAIGLGLWAGTGAFAYAAPILGQINADIGPDDRYVWIGLVYTVCSAVWFPIIGRLGDIFGRRWLMILGGVFGIIGSIVCAVAPNILVLIGGNVFLGSASAFQLSFSYVLQELLPMVCTTSFCAFYVSLTLNYRNTDTSVPASSTPGPSQDQA